MRRGRAIPSAASCLVRDRIAALLDPGSPFLELSALAAHDMYGGDVASAGIVTGIGRINRLRLRHRRQRRHHQGRHLLSDDGEEASARAGDRARQSPAVHLSGRFRRRVPAAAGRDLSRSRSLRPHLLQPGADVGGRHSADRGGAGLLHRRRRLCAGDVGRGRHREEPGHDLPRRAAAGEGRDRRGGDRRGARRRRRAQPPVRRHRLSRRERRPCARDRAPAGRQSQPRAASLAVAARAARTALSAREPLRHRAGQSADAL